jgi:ATP-dependent DNA helicase RecG
LLAFKSETDGFKIAEKDLEMRGGGDFMGTRQSGKILGDIKNLRYPTQVIFAAKRLSDDTFEARLDDERLREVALKKYDSLKDVVLN